MATPRKPVAKGKQDPDRPLTRSDVVAAAGASGKD